MSRRKERTRARSSFSLRPVLVLALPHLLLIKAKLSRINQSEGKLAIVAWVSRLADECQTLGLTVLGTALFFLGSMLEAESSPEKFR